MKPKDNNENAKDPDWIRPMKMPGVKKGIYDASMGAPGGTSEDMLELSKQGKFLSAKGKGE